MKLTKVLPIIAMLLVVFVAGCKKDEDPGLRPTVLSTSPIADATNLDLTSKITLVFSTPMDAATITASTFTLKKADVSIAGTVSLSGSTATFSPSANLAPNTAYKATMATGASDLQGMSIEKDYVWNFTTGTIPDATAPTVTLSDPANLAAGVAINKAVMITFSESMDQTTITASTFTLKQGTTSISGTVTKAAATGTFTPATSLEYNKVYTATVATGAKDLAGNAIASNYSFSFTTVSAPDTTLPTVNTISPLNNATGIARNKVLTLTFSEAMDPLTVTSSTFTLKQGTTAVSGTVAYSGTTSTFTPTNDLAANTAYTATITTGAKDAAGNALAANTVWSFTTGSTASTLTAVDLGASGNYVILAKTTITNVPTSAITGDLGLSPAATSFFTGFALTNATGFATSSQVTGKLYAADMVSPTPINLTTAVSNMMTAYTDAAGRPTPDFSELGTGNIGGKTLTEGLYKWTSTVTIPSSVTISGGANDVFIFQISGDLTMGNAVNMTLIGGVQPRNIFWQVAGTVTIGTSSHVEGVILSQTAITFKTNASLKGRALAQTAVILDANAITKPN